MCDDVTQLVQAIFPMEDQRACRGAAEEAHRFQDGRFPLTACMYMTLNGMRKLGHVNLAV